MKHPRLMYSNFSSTLTDFGYIIRSLWIGVFGFLIVVVNAFESNSGFSGILSLEGYVAFITIATYFMINLFSQESKTLKIAFAIVAFLNLIFSSVLTSIAYDNINYSFISSLMLAIYSLVALLLVLKVIQKNT